MTRAELKLDAKNKMYKNYGLLLATMGIAVLGNIITTASAAVVGPFAALVSFVVTACIELSTAYACLKISKEGKADFEDLITPLKENLLEKLLTIFLARIYVFLWSLLFVIPGIIKGFSYSQLLYILVEDGQNIYYNDAITKSRQIMDGHKMELFVLELSFILWGIGTVITFGILGLYTVPYMSLTMSNYYLSLTGFTGVSEKVVNEEEIKDAININ